MNEALPLRRTPITASALPGTAGSRMSRLVSGTLSERVTLRPGDLIATGTPHGVGKDEASGSPMATVS